MIMNKALEFDKLQSSFWDIYDLFQSEHLSVNRKIVRIELSSRRENWSNNALDAIVRAHLRAVELLVLWASWSTNVFVQTVDTKWAALSWVTLWVLVITPFADE